MKTTCPAKILSAVVIISAATLTSCIPGVVKVTSNKNNIDRKINIDTPFTAILSEGETDVIYKDGPLSISLNAPENKIDDILVKVSDGTLIVTVKENRKNHNFNGRYHSTLTVSAPGVSDFRSTGTGDFDISDLDVPVATFITEGTGDFEAETVKCDKFILNSRGTGDADFRSVNAEYVTLRSDGTGDLDIKTIVCSEADITSNGTGNVTLNDGNIKSGTLTNNGVGDIEIRNVKFGNVSVLKYGTGDISIKK